MWSNSTKLLFLKMSMHTITMKTINLHNRTSFTTYTVIKIADVINIIIVNSNSLSQKYHLTLSLQLQLTASHSWQDSFIWWTHFITTGKGEVIIPF